MTLRRVHRGLLRAAVVALVVLGLSGAWLARWYRPAAVLSGGVHRPTDVTVVMGIHRAGAAVLLLAVAVLVGVRLVDGARRAVWPALAAVTGVALVVTGRSLVWDLLALRAVRVDGRARGVLFAAFDDIVRFVIVDGVELTQAGYRWLLVLHTVALPVVLGGLLVLQRERDTPTAPGT